jgi:hypothetical protein
VLVDHRFRLQNTWLGCNGVIALFAFAIAVVLVVLGAVRLRHERGSAN